MKVIRLQGRFPMPGFIEGHRHFVGLGHSKMMLAEVRQALQRLLDRIDAGTPETLRAFRAVEVLEHIAAPAVREHLKTLAAGQPGAEPTVAAAAALQRLNQ
jgi:predicted amidohydrolase YtcJ